MSAVAGKRVWARVEDAESLARRLPSLPGVVAVPRLSGWAVRGFGDLATRIRGEIVRAVTARDVHKTNLEAALHSRLELAKRAVSSRFGVSHDPVTETCKSWCVAHRSDPVALEVLCDSKDLAMDGAVVASILDSAAGFGEMGRSRVVTALAERLLHWQTATKFPEGASKLLHAAEQLPWEAPGHEGIAASIVQLDRELSYEAQPEDRQQLEKAIDTTLEQLIDRYADHPRISVIEEVGKTCERGDVLRKIGERAEAVFAIDPRLTYRVVAALAANAATPAEVLHPFARAELWAKGQRERHALDALLARAVGRRLGAPAAAEPEALVP